PSAMWSTGTSRTEPAGASRGTSSRVSSYPNIMPSCAAPRPSARRRGVVLRSNSSETYFCNEPWLGVLGIETNFDVTFCPCYLKLKLGNLRQQRLEELWNTPALADIR